MPTSVCAETDGKQCSYKFSKKVGVGADVRQSLGQFSPSFLAGGGWDDPGSTFSDCVNSIVLQMWTLFFFGLIHG